jgi:hypothetical protein
VNTVDLDISAETTFPSSRYSNASFSLSLERTGEVDPKTLEEILESAIENTDASFSPPSEGLGEANSNLVEKTPLNLPQGETFVPALERQKEQNSPPSEGLGEVLKTQLF